MSQVIPLGPGSRMLTTREAAQRLGVSLRTVQLWVEADILPAARTPGGHRRIPHNAVEALALSTGLGGEPLARPSRVEARARDRDHAHAEAAVSEAERHPALANGPVLRPRDVLLVADNPIWQVRCEQALAPFLPSIELRFAETGYLALLQIGQKAPDLLITSLELPGMDGLAMLRTLERCESIAGMRILALSHLDEAELKRRGGLPASAELMQLPVSPEGVAVRVGRWLLHQRVS
ncbi:helix-turn-helix domain-containing protein [Aquabacterium sp. UBA2148]|uniref:helix-turn-helix domain-containing protein n=1 Tax=Aquabacterium sp. UBA2148 TaxID=1946042 RepID=UPI00258083F0|nr:helix-turn-helix domain-containing protein [Aquabacterium sp. UBA2148]